MVTTDYNEHQCYVCELVQTAKLLSSRIGVRGKWRKFDIEGSGRLPVQDQDTVTTVSRHVCLLDKLSLF